MIRIYYILKISVTCTNIRFGIYAMVKIHIVIWIMKPCNLVGGYHHFSEIRCLHHQCRWYPGMVVMKDCTVHLLASFGVLVCL